MSSFRFVKGSAVRTRNVWPIKAKVMALSLYRSGKTAVDAVTAVAAEFDIDLSATESYTKNAGSHIGRFQREVSRLLERGDNDTVTACRELGLEVEAVQE